MKKIVLSFLVVAVTSSCSQKTGKDGILSKIISSDLFSTRAQKSAPYVGLIQLKEPALLSTAEIKNGKAIIDDEKKEALLAEQDEVIQKLQELSSEIKIVATYKLVLNAIAIVAPSDLTDKISTIEGVAKVVENTNFERPKTFASNTGSNLIKENIEENNSITFIKADVAHKLGFKGQGMRVGVIDTGIDYTHSMLGGPGKSDVYKSINPSTTNEFFPNTKVVGGMDFVGSNFNTRIDDIEAQTPVRDPNPIDEAEHGTHVSGTVAGIGDGKNTYSGVAPEASLYALKVFGKEGSTSDIAVIEALEYAADPSEKLDTSDRLDVVNLSLGGGYGKPKILYTEAIKNLTRGGTVVVASAGNSGDNPYIVGAPSTADEAISVAASIDNMAHNISSPAVELLVNGNSILAERVEGNISTPVDETNVSGELVYIGNAKDEISEEVKNKVQGKIALIDRGAISFADKFKVAQNLKAIGVVVANTVGGAPIQMGGEGHFDFPAVMIAKDLGNIIRDELKKGTVVKFNFNTDKIITNNDLIDQITNFSSRGPRSMDSLIKPEIAGPGFNIISAKSGSGNEGVQFSGTSMSGPHLAGVMTLLKQANPTLSTVELKTKVLNNAKILMKNGVHVPVSLQGAGRVQVDQAVKSKVLAMPATISLGEIAVASKKSVGRKIEIRNTSDKDLVFTSRVISSKNIQASVLGSFRVKANSSITINASFSLTRNSTDENNIEADGFIILRATDGSEEIHLPFLAVLNKVSNIIPSDFVTLTNSKDDLSGTEVSLKLTNKGKNEGDALIFNMLGTDDRRVAKLPINSATDLSCDLEAAGIRIIERNTSAGMKKILQVGVKLYDALTMWQPCDISLQIDNNNDGVADQELVGIKAEYVSGVKIDSFASLLLDARKAREIRAQYEKQTSKDKEEDYTEALQAGAEMKFYDHASVAMIETDLSKVITDKNGNVKIKLSVTNLEANENADDFLGSHEKSWQSLNLSENAFSFYEMPEKVIVAPNDELKISMKRGNGNSRLLVLFPHNTPFEMSSKKDLQSQVLVEKIQK